MAAVDAVFDAHVHLAISDREPETAARLERLGLAISASPSNSQ